MVMVMVITMFFGIKNLCPSTGHYREIGDFQQRIPRKICRISPLRGKPGASRGGRGEVRLHE
jgi:hypothetical protein